MAKVIPTRPTMKTVKWGMISITVIKFASLSVTDLQELSRSKQTCFLT